MRELWISLLSLTLLGCAAKPPSEFADASAQIGVEEVRTPIASGSDLVCTTGRATGSHIASRQCITRAEEARISEASQEWVRTRGTRGSPYVVPDPADPRADDPDSPE